jgi:hypothetical protein
MNESITVETSVATGSQCGGEGRSSNHHTPDTGNEAKYVRDRYIRFGGETAVETKSQRIIQNVRYITLHNDLLSVVGGQDSDFGKLGFGFHLCGDFSFAQ